MKKVEMNNFSNEDIYGLYRTIREIIHPAISKKNISNYKIVLDEKLYSVMAFYPKRVSNLKSAIIYIPGDGEVSGCRGKYFDICKDIALQTNKLVIAIDYFDDKIKYPTTINKCIKTINYIVDEFSKNDIKNEDIILMGDSTGCNILGSVVSKLASKKKCFSKMILFYPVVRNDYSNYSWNESLINLNFNLEKKLVNYFKKYLGNKNDNNDTNLLNVDDFSLFPKTLVIGGEMDLLKDDGLLLIEKMSKDISGCSCYNIMYASHGFLNGNDEIILEEAYKVIRDFV